MADNANPVNKLTLGLSSVTRILFWGSTIYIIYVSAVTYYTLMNLHVAFSTVGCALLMVEATLVVTGDALLVARYPKGVRVRIHWILHTVGLALLIVGFFTILAFKMKYNLPHFISDHGKVGLASFIIALVVALCAVPTLFRRLVPEAVNFGSFKRSHVYFGIASTILLLAGQITGLYAGWWRTSSTGRDLVVAANVIGGFCLLIRPLYRTLWRSFH